MLSVSETPNRKIGPSRWFHLLGVALIVLGAYGGYEGVLSFMRSLSAGTTRAVFPGEIVTTFTAPGEYKIYYESQSVLNGRVFDTGEKLPGLTFEVNDVKTGESIPLSAPRYSETYQLNGRVGRTVLRFQISQPGEYKVVAHYIGENQGDEAVFAVGNLQIFHTILALFSAIACVVLLGTGGLAVIIVVEVRRSSAERKLDAAAAGVTPMAPTPQN